MSDVKPGAAAISPAAIIDHLTAETDWLRKRCIALTHALNAMTTERDGLKAQIAEQADDEHRETLDA